MIRTIQDLESLSEEEVERVRSSIKLRDHYYRGANMMGRTKGLTLAEYEEWFDSAPEEECRTCSGTGLWRPKKRSVGTIHASSAHGCRRRLYYDVMAEHAPKQTIRPELAITFAIGHAIHDVVQKALHTSLPGKFEDEVRVDNPEAFVLNSVGSTITLS